MRSRGVKYLPVSLNGKLLVLTFFSVNILIGDGSNIRNYETDLKFRNSHFSLSYTLIAI